MKTLNTTAKGIALMLVSVLLIPITDVIAKWMTGEYSVLQVVWMRFTFTLLILLPAFFLLVRRQTISMLPDKPVLEFLRALSMLLNIFFYFKAIQLLPLANALGIFFLYPIVTLLISAKFLDEYIGTKQLVMLMFGFCGVLLIIKPGLDYSEGSLYAVLSGICISINMVLSRYLSPHSSPVLGLFYTSLLGFVVMSCIVWAVWKPPDETDWMAFILMSVVAALCNWLLYTALKYAPASMLSPLGYFEIVSTTVMGYWVFGNLPDHITAVGLVMVVLSGLVLTLKKNRVAMT